MFASKFLKFAVSSAIPVALAMGSLTALAQTFPSKAINVVVPFPAGGSADFVARFMTKEMATTLKQPMLVDNVTGVGGALGVMKALNAAPDGHTLLLSDVNSLILTPIANINAKYKSEEVKTVAMVGAADIMLAVRKELAVNTLDEFIAMAKKSADKPLNYCSSGVGSQFHLMAERFNQIAGVKTMHVPYNALPPCIQNMMGNLVDFAFLPIAGPFPGFVESGNLKIIAIAGAKPHPIFSKEPLFRSQKGFENFVFNAWAAFHVSPKVSDETVAVLNKSATDALLTEFVKTTIAASGSIPFDAMTPAESHAFYLREAAKYQAIAKSIDLKPQQ